MDKPGQDCTSSGLNLTRGEIQFITLWRFILRAFHYHPQLTEYHANNVEKDVKHQIIVMVMCEAVLR